jgi:hypothetical protein
MRIFPPKQTTSAFLDGAVCKRATYGCTGVKACKYLTTEPSWDHREVSQEIWQRLQHIRESAARSDLRTRAVQ